MKSRSDRHDSFCLPHKSPSRLFLPCDVIALCSTATAAAALSLATRVTGSRQSSQEEARKEGRRGGKRPEITNYGQTPSNRFLTVPMSSGEKCGVLSSERRRDGEGRVQLHNERLQLDNLTVI